MKKFIYLFAVCLLALTIVSFSIDNRNDFEIPEDPATEYVSVFAKDFLCSLNNDALENRFETQFHTFLADVMKVDVHFNDTNGYYYAVHGINPNGDTVVEYFKTTAEEVSNNEYNYIEMNADTMEAISKGAQACREGTFPFPNGFCSQFNSGVICGIVINGYCRYY
ncbi:hypothetical protein POV27_05755 [Aureisphaera galaxeae]|uniref:hypothetical protein n=1 Tax=Aureisphaera galaxeae TaxID=1538023 RepID=UPI00234FD855|nr:hypothetical protein [Aureisphaera galaxeae]MDC8003546.1 hypothetical protein [Aureisphaera galaxeae]